MNGIQAHPKAGCGNCGADIPIPPAGGIVRCGFCSTSLYVESRGTVRHFVYRPAVASDEVDGSVGRWLFEQGVSARVDVQERRLVYYPFWRVERGGRVDLVPAAASPEGPLDESFDGLRASSGTRPLDGIRRPAGELEPYDVALEDGGTFVSTTMPPPEGEDVWLVHVPVWHASFTIGAARETVLVEATAGRVIAATAPPGTLGRASSKAGWILWGGGAVLLLLGGFLPWGWAALAGWLVTCAGVFLLLSVRTGGGGT